MSGPALAERLLAKPFSLGTLVRAVEEALASADPAGLPTTPAVGTPPAPGVGQERLPVA